MIISASRKTDIPAYYADWFLRRLREREVFLPSPRKSGKPVRLSLAPDDVDCLLFWTRNPYFLLDKLKKIKNQGYEVFFQFSLTPYGRDLEPGLPPKNKLTDILRTMSLRLGPERIVWRYDPVILGKDMPPAWHLDQFSRLSSLLQPYCHACAFAFMDQDRPPPQGYAAPDELERASLDRGFRQIAKAYGLPVQDAPAGEGLERTWMEAVLGRDLSKADCLDIGREDTCPAGCAYCANLTNKRRLSLRRGRHNPASPLLTGIPPKSGALKAAGPKQYNLLELA